MTRREASSDSVGPGSSSTSFHVDDADDENDSETDPDLEEVSPGERDWLPEACLSRGRLRAQNAYIKRVIHRSIDLVEKDMITKHAWPELHCSAQYRWDTIMDALDELCVDDEGFDRIRERAGIDEKFVKTIGAWVIFRTSWISFSILMVISLSIAYPSTATPSKVTSPATLLTSIDWEKAQHVARE